MGRINSVQFRHTIVERMLGCGTLVIESASDEPLEFDDVPGVESVHSLLYSQMAEVDERRERRSYDRYDERRDGGTAGERERVAAARPPPTGCRRG